jgi:hypothetical protein
MTGGGAAMGTDIDQEQCGVSDYLSFVGRLEECLSVLGQLV